MIHQKLAQTSNRFTIGGRPSFFHVASPSSRSAVIRQLPSVSSPFHATFLCRTSESKCSRSRSSSSSSSSKSLQDDVPKAELKSDSFNRARLASTETAAEKQTPWRAFQVRFRGRGWKKGNHPGDCDPDIAGAPKNEDWDKESPPKSRAYYLHDDRDAKGEASKQMDNRGGLGGGGLSRGWPRFLIRKTNVGGANITWAQDKFLVNGEKSGMQEDHTERQKKDGNT